MLFRTGTAFSTFLQKWFDRMDAENIGKMKNGEIACSYLPVGARVRKTYYLNFTAVPYAMTSAAPCMTAAEA